MQYCNKFITMKIFLSLNLLEMMVEKQKGSPTDISAAKGKIGDIWGLQQDQTLMLLPRLLMSPSSAFQAHPLRDSAFNHSQKSEDKW